MVALVERGGRARVQVVERVDAETLKDAILENVDHNKVEDAERTVASLLQTPGKRLTYREAKGSIRSWMLLKTERPLGRVELTSSGTLAIAMPSQPLFHERLLSSHRDAYAPSLTGHQKTTLRGLLTTITKDITFSRQTEASHKGKFLNDLFSVVLGYSQRIGSHDAYHLIAEGRAPDFEGSRPADAVIGFYGVGGDVTRVVVEIKPPDTGLDQKQYSHNGLTPVEQAFCYANEHDDCRWVIVSNFATLRLYSTLRGRNFYKEFSLRDLSNDERLREFLSLLDVKMLLGEARQEVSSVERLLTASRDQQAKIGNEFYAVYHKLRIDLFGALSKTRPAWRPPNRTQWQTSCLELAQKLMDRAVFICFCEQTGLLPKATLSGTVNRTGIVPTWDKLNSLFDVIDKGRQNIHGYNGGLFRRDERFEGINLSDEMVLRIVDLSKYDYQSDLTVSILGHIFEQSVADIEQIRAEIREEKFDPKRTKRKTEGVVYTPDYITAFIVQRVIGKWLEDKRRELREPPPMSEDELKKVTYKADGTIDKRTRTGVEVQKRLDFWLAYKDVLARIRILDPACGSGAFLLQAYDFIYNEATRVNVMIERLSSRQAYIFELDKQILRNNLYGVDINAESVEITKLSLWLKTASMRSVLTDLDENIRCGDALIDDPFVARTAFDWAAEFPGVLALRRRLRRSGGVRHALARENESVEDAPGFDIILGNPPYFSVDDVWGKNSREAASLREAYPEVFSGKSDVFYYFFSKAHRLLKSSGGHVGFLTSRYYLEASNATFLRDFIHSNFEIAEILDFASYPAIRGIGTKFAITVLHRPNTEVGIGANHLVNFYQFPRRLSDEEVRSMLLADVVPFNTKEQASISDGAPWSINAWLQEELNEAVDLNTVPLGEIAYVGKGMETGRNGVFVVSAETVHRYGIEPAYLRPLIKNEDIRRYKIASRTERLVYPENLQEASRSNAMGYLREHETTLKERAAYIRENCEWHKYTWPLHKEMYGNPKIVTPFVAGDNSFAVDEAGLGIGLTDTYAIFFDGRSEYDHWYALALLNSEVLRFRYRSIGKLKDYRREYVKHQLAMIPIRRIEFERRPGKVVRDVGQMYELSLRTAEDVARAGGDAYSFTSNPCELDLHVRQCLSSGKTVVLHNTLAQVARLLADAVTEEAEVARQFWEDLEGVCTADEFDYARKGRQEQTLWRRSEACRRYVTEDSSQLKGLADSLLWNEQAYKEFLRQLLGSIDHMSQFVTVYRRYASVFDAAVRRRKGLDTVVDRIVYQLYGLSEEQALAVGAVVNG